MRVLPGIATIKRNRSTRNGPTQRLLQGSSPTDGETHLVNWRSFEDTCKYVRFVMMYGIANEYVAVKNST